ncbi:Ydc2-catalyt-domain-containing protein [Xylariaceae sp. FL0662B]|nr:Ydc2-catalyt-domain-containing protein [Xylariaceae sp. FL0662B]
MAAAKLAIKLQQQLKQPQLKQLSFLCGLKTSGTKGELAVALSQVAKRRQAELATDRGHAENQRILSIDLGIRNLGYGLLTGAPAAARRNAATARADGVAGLRRPLPVHLHEWKRRELLTDGEPGALFNDAFHPASMAAMTDRLVRHTLLPLRPTHVLIERQRFRSGGAAAVQEWTLRVNTLEAMLHASLRTLRELGHWDGEVISIPPGRVAPFWLSDDVAAAAAAAESKREDAAGDGTDAATEMLKKLVAETAKVKVNSKKLKIDTVGRWLDQGDIITPQGTTADIAVKSYYHHWKRFYHTWRRITRKKWKDEEQGAELYDDSRKLDDLADSLLQGMAWMRWEENKRLLFSEGQITGLFNADKVDLSVDNTIHTSQPVI